MAIAMLSLALAVALTYVVGDLYSPFMPVWLAWICHIAVCFALYKVVSHYLRQLRE